MTRLERDVWVAAFAASSVTLSGAPVAVAFAAVRKLRESDNYLGSFGEHWANELQKDLRALLASEAEEGNE